MRGALEQFAEAEGATLLIGARRWCSASKDLFKVTVANLVMRYDTPDGNVDWTHSRSRRSSISLEVWRSQ